MCLILFFIAGVWDRIAFGAALPQFAYRELTLIVVQADGRPIPDASVYGFCREFNLICPRRDHELEGRNDVVWNEAYLGKTGPDGTIKLTVPPGKWGFFAAGSSAPRPGVATAAWADFRDRSAGEKVRLRPTLTKRWLFCSSEGDPMTPNRIFVRPEGFPVWIPLAVKAPQGLTMEISSGNCQLWGSGEGIRQSFVLSWGVVSAKTPDGKILLPEDPALIDLRGGKSRSALQWARPDQFGLEGEVALPDGARMLFSPGRCMLAYRRPVAGGLRADFAGQIYNLEPNGRISFNLDAPLQAGVDHQFGDPDKKGQAKLSARLYIVDANGHLLAELLEASGKPAAFAATVMLDGKRIIAHQVSGKSDIPGQGEAGQTMFEANVGTIRSGAGAIWEFRAPAGILPKAAMPEDDRVTVSSRTFKMEVPKVLQKPAQNLVAQADTLAEQMETVSGRKRQRQMTSINVKPGRSGASASHSGAFIGIGTKLFFSDMPMLRHDIGHELGHNFNLTHGGLHETVVEATRSFGGEQISQQPAKWMFFDRMNGITRKEVMYHNTGLYLFCYAQGGPSFLRFMLINESPVRDKLTKQTYSGDEAIAGLLSAALDRDMEPVCRAYGFKLSPGKVAPASRLAREFARKP